jgi:hypothetical protein
MPPQPPQQPQPQQPPRGRTEAWGAGPNQDQPRGRTDAWTANPAQGGPQPGGPQEEAWWDGTAAPPAPPAVEGGEKTKKSRWGRNKDKDAQKSRAADEWATEAPEQPQRRNDEPVNWGNRPEPGERIPEQRKRDPGAFEDLAPLELNLDEEPKEKSRRFLRRK